MSRVSRSRRQAIAGGAALVIGGVAASAVQAQQQRRISFEAEEPNSEIFLIDTVGSGPLEERRKKWLQAVADKLGLTSDKLESALEDASKELGITPPPMMPPLPIGGLVPPGGPNTFSLHIDSPLGPAAKALGISEDQLKSEWANKSLTDIARAHNVDAKAVGDALKAQRITQLDQAVATGKLPATLADRLKKNLNDEIDHLMQFAGGPGRAIFRFERQEQRGSAP